MANKMSNTFENINLSRHNSFKHLINQYDNDQNEDYNDIKVSAYFNNLEMMNIFNYNKQLFNIISLNCQGIKNKFDEIRIVIENWNNQIKNNRIDVIFLQETWIQNKSDITMYEMTDYNIYFKRDIYSGSSHRGLITYIHKKYKAKTLNIGQDNRMYEKLFHEIKYI